MGQDDEIAVAEILRQYNLVLGDKHFVHFFAGSDADIFNDRFTVAELSHHDPCHHIHGGRRHFHNEYLSPFRRLKGLKDETNGFSGAHQKPCHASIGQRDLVIFPDLLRKQGNDTAGSADHIAAPYAHERCGRGIVFVCIDDQFLAARLGDAVQIIRLHRFVGGNIHHFFDVVPNGRLDNILRAVNVRQHRFPGVVFADGHMLQCREMKYVIRSAHSEVQDVLVAHIANDELDPRIRKCATHLHLCMFSARINANLFGAEPLQCLSGKLPPPRTGASRYKNSRIVE